VKGVIVKSTGSWYLVKSETGDIVECRIRGKFRIQGIKSTNPVAVGDQVIFEMEPNKDTGLITELLDRKNYIIRKSVNLSKRTHIIAANVDLALLVITVENPTTFPLFIDRFLASCEAYNVQAVLLFNKMDNLSEEGVYMTAGLMEIYESIGYTCFGISAKLGEGLEELKEMMKDKISVLSGHSGVGKSTLINQLQPGLQIKTSEISEGHKQGQHTTTFAEMHDLDFGGYIIDTPGIKGFGVVDFEPQQIGDYFPEIFEIKDACKFHNCLHIEEPKCAVKAAVEEGLISESRYYSYLQLVEDGQETYR
jgi:ribosome biogenesis GTPase